MIVDSGIYLFDYRRFHEQVVPDFRQLHTTNEVEPWLEAVWNRRHKPSPVPRLTPHLREVTAGLMASHDLAGDVPIELIPLPTRRPKRRPASDVQAAANCSEPRWDCAAVENWQEWQDLQYLFQVAVEETCLGGGAYMGNAQHATMFDTCSDTRWRLSYNQDVWPLLTWLEERGRAWAHGNEDSAEGIRGWLDSDESWLLADGLDQLSLPQHEATFTAIQAARADDIGTCSQGDSCPRRLAAVRAIATLAAEQGHGVLWGWDLTPPETAPFV